MREIDTAAEIPGGEVRLEHDSPQTPASVCARPALFMGASDKTSCTTRAAVLTDC